MHKHRLNLTIRPGDKLDVRLELPDCELSKDAVVAFTTFANCSRCQVLGKHAVRVTMEEHETLAVSRTQNYGLRVAVDGNSFLACSGQLFPRHDAKAPEALRAISDKPKQAKPKNVHRIGGEDVVVESKPEESLVR